MYIRPYAKADFEAVYALDQVCFSARFRFSRAMMRRVVGGSGAVVLLACEAGANGTERMLGFCAAEVTTEAEGIWAYLSTLDVAPDARGMGVGQALMSALEQVVHAAKAACLLLHVYVDNEAAVRLYQRLGYEQIGREHSFYGRGFDAWVYRKRLFPV